MRVLKQAGNHTTTDLLALPPPLRIIDIEPTALARGMSHACILTTDAVLWLDEVTPGAPALSWRHDLGARAHHSRVLHIPHLMHG
jgi:hypothetical protein